jgi:hypothetical protein
MAAPSTEIDVLDRGIEQDSPSKGSFALNMLYRRNSWEVRKGFGQVSQRTTTFGLPTVDATGLATRPNVGMRKHLGSYMLETDFGHTQCLSIFSALVRTGNALTNDDMTNSYTDYVIVVEIDDLTTGDHWEEPLYTHTAESVGFGAEFATSQNKKNFWGSQITTNYSGAPPPYWHGQYDTSVSNDRTAFKAATSDAAFFFHEWRGVLYFGSPSVGIFIYRPIIIGKTERRYLEYDITIFASNPYAERAFIRPLVPTPNPAYEAAYTYLNKATFPGDPVDVAVIDDRLVVAADRTLYFSDPNQPGFFVGINQIHVPSSTPITAIEQHYGHLMIFTETETFMFRSAGGAIYGGGQVSKVDENVGCFGPNALAVADGSLIWSDKNGVYATTGNLVVTKISGGIDSFFNGFFSSPLTSYYTTSTSPGFSNTANDQPQTQFTVSAGNAHLCYNAELGALFAVYPDSEAIFCYADNKWSLWTTETQATNTANLVIATQTITNAWIVSSEERLVMVGSLDSQTLVDEAKTQTGAAVDNDIPVESYYLLEYGRGGALDRSVSSGEDMRKPTGYYKYTPSGGRSANHCKVREFERIPTGYAFPDGSWTIGATTYTVVRPEDIIYWVPISVLVTDVNYVKVQAWDVEVFYDHNAWEPVMYANNSDIDFFVPCERIVTKPGYNPGAGNATAKVINAGSSGVQIRFNRTEDPSGRYIYLTPGVEAVMLYVPMRLKEASKTDSLSELVITISGCTVTSPTGTKALDPWVWKEYFIGTTESRNSDNVAMPVDWAYKTKQVNLNGQTMLKARGLYVRLSSRGPGDSTSNLTPNFLFGLFNTLLGCDEKGWVSQVVDYTGVTGVNAESLFNIANKNSIRTRIRDTSGDMVNKAFDQAGVTYGANGSTTAGSYLIDDQAVSIISTSDSVKGFSFSYMLFGHIQNRAQGVRIEDAKASIRQSGSRRRTGR